MRATGMNECVGFVPTGRLSVGAGERPAPMRFIEP